MGSHHTRYVLFLQASIAPGGSKYSLLDTIQVLQETIYQPVVACSQQGWLSEQLERVKVPYVVLPFYAWRKWLERPRVLPSIRKHWLPALARWRFDIIHSNEFWWAPHAIALAKRLEIPAVVHLRDGHHTLKKARQYQLKDADAVLAVSSELRDQFSPDSRLYDKTLVLFNGHKELVFDGGRDKARGLFNLRSEELVVGNAGKISERKNQRLLLGAMAHLKEQRRVVQFKILFAGDADPDYAQLMVQEVQRLGLQDEVKFLGRLENMDAFFSATDLFVHCARREGLPRVVPEAMLARRAVVATAAQGIHDTIPNEQFGSIVPAGDQTLLENKIERLLKKPALRASIADRAYERAHSLFSFESHRDRLSAIYSELLAVRPQMEHQPDSCDPTALDG